MKVSRQSVARWEWRGWWLGAHKLAQCGAFLWGQFAFAGDGGSGSYLPYPRAAMAQGSCRNRVVCTALLPGVVWSIRLLLFLLSLPVRLSVTRQE